MSEKAPANGGAAEEDERRRKPARRIAIAAAIVVVAVLVAAQLLGPTIAAREIRGEVGKYGTVRSVSVSAWPAIELAWRHADEVKVSAGRLRMSPAQTTSLLREASGTTTMNVQTQVAEVSGLRLTDVMFIKHKSKLWATGTMSQVDVAKALPPGVGVSLIESSGGKVLVRVSGGLFGVSATVEAAAYAQNGALVASPTGLLLSGLRLTLFSSPEVYVEGVHARELEKGPGPGPGSGSSPGAEARYRLSLWGRLR